MEYLSRKCTVFEGSRRIASGELEQVVVKVKEVVGRGEEAPVLVFDDTTGRVIDMDLRGTAEEVLARLARRSGDGEPASADGEREAPRGPGRPKLGVVGREVTLLPRHWEWLNAQPGGASVALRKLVDEARRASEGRDGVRAARETAYRFMSAMAGDEPGYEDAIRALYADDPERFDERIRPWPADVRDHARKLASAAFESEAAASAAGRWEGP